MARYNEILVGRFNRFVQKLTAIKGGPPVAQIGGEVVPTIPFFNGVENRYLESWDRYASGVIVPAAGAANNGFWRLRNPAGSNVLAVLEFLIASPNAAAQTDLFAVQAGAASVELATLLGSGFSLDPRGRPNSALLNSTNAAGLAGTGLSNTIFQSGFLTASAGWQFIQCEDQEIPLLPGRAIGVTNFTANQAFAISFITRERFLEESERA